MEQKYELLNFVTYIIQYLLQNTIIIKPIIKNMKRGRNMITQNEYKLLKHCRATGYRWIARDKNNGLYVYATEPEKRECEWRTNKFNSSGVYNDDGYHLFQYIKWEDEEPTKILDLIQDYESHQVITGGNNVNKSELVKEIEEILDDIAVSDYQLGECDENTIWTISSITIRKILSAIEKHSPDNAKATVPQFVADWIEEIKDKNCAHALEILFDTASMPTEVYDWLKQDSKNWDIMARAWLNGYEVEKEKLYTVRLTNGDCLCRFKSLGIDWAKGQDYRNDKDFQLTQAEIESVDSRLMQFAEKVE